RTSSKRSPGKKPQREKVTTMTTKSERRGSSGLHFYPGRMLENSPTFQFQRWVHKRRGSPVPTATAEAATRCIGFFLLATSCFAARTADSEPLKLIQTIPLPGVKGRFDHFAIDATGN